MSRSQIPTRSLAIAETVAAIARESGYTPAQVALAAIRADPRFGPVIPIVGARTAEQLSDSLGRLDLVLTPEQRARIDRVSGIEPGFPHDFLDTDWMRKMYRSELLDNHRAR
jgi:aryl-alcohol dehydrogenase-like predicted oxidoreductase